MSKPTICGMELTPEQLAQKKAAKEAYHRQWVKRNLKTQAAYLRKWRKNNKAKFNQQVSKWQKENREKINAYRKMRTALKNGTITRLYVCQDCNSKANRIDAHHEDYSKPLDVLWLCRQCHRNRHPSKHRGEELRGDSNPELVVQRSPATE